MKRKVELFWDSEIQGTYNVGSKKEKRERYLAKKAEAKERKNANSND
jgi:hypothetical protein